MFLWSHRHAYRSSSPSIFQLDFLAGNHGDWSRVTWETHGLERLGGLRWSPGSGEPGSRMRGQATCSREQRSRCPQQKEAGRSLLWQMLSIYPAPASLRTSKWWSWEELITSDIAPPSKNWCSSFWTRKTHLQGHGNKETEGGSLARGCVEKRASGSLSWCRERSGPCGLRPRGVESTRPPRGFLPLHAFISLSCCLMQTWKDNHFSPWIKEVLIVCAPLTGGRAIPKIYSVGGDTFAWARWSLNIRM